jgi:hypothetical protein
VYTRSVHHVYIQLSVERKGTMMSLFDKIFAMIILLNAFAQILGFFVREYNYQQERKK